MCSGCDTPALEPQQEREVEAEEGLDWLGH